MIVLEKAMLSIGIMVVINSVAIILLYIGPIRTSKQNGTRSNNG